MNTNYTAKRTIKASTVETCSSVLRDGELVADCTTWGEAQHMAQMLNEHAALVAVEQAAQEFSNFPGKAANEVLLEALANLAVVRGNK